MLENLRSSVEKYRKYARINYYIAYILHFVSFLASASGVLLAFQPDTHRLALALLTALPGLIILLNSTFRFSERANWHFEKKNRLNALLRVSEVRGLDCATVEFAEKWNAIDEAMEKKWPTFSTSTVSKSKS